MEFQLDPVTMIMQIKGFPDAAAQLNDAGVLSFLAGDDEVKIHRDSRRITVVDPVSFLDAAGTCLGESPLWNIETD